MSEEIQNQNVNNNQSNEEKMPDNTAAQNAGNRAWQIHALNLDTESLVGR